MIIYQVDYHNVPNIKDSSLCLGFFDALHLGHLSLIYKAQSLNKPVVLLTMDKSPKEFFSKEKEYAINSSLDKQEILTKLGVDALIEIKVDEEFFSLTPEEFVNEVINKIGANNVICGFDYSFGKNKLGNPDLLKKLGKDKFNVFICQPILNNYGTKISSTLIKSLIEEGNIEKANRYLSRPYRVVGEVIHGNHLGNTIGFATANLKNDNYYIYPKNGVYGGIVKVKNKFYKTMINVGTHPTIQELPTKIIEANIIDFNEDIYGETIEVYFIYFLRNEKKFASFDLLKEELIKNRESIKKEIKLEDYLNK